MPKRVLVTGAAGYIGGQTMIGLTESGIQVIGVDFVALPVHLRKFPQMFFQEDFASRRGLDILEEYNFDAVIHCAGTSLVGPSISNPALYYQNNFYKTKQLLDFIVKHKKDLRLVFSSSAACYGDPVTLPCNETDVCVPISPYGQSKLMIEWMLAAYQKAYGLDSVAFRYFNACGADHKSRHGQAPGATHIIARVLESIRDNRTFVLNGDDYDTPDGTCVRDYVHVEDIAAAHIQAIDRSRPSGVFNLGTKAGASNREIIKAAEKITGRTALIEVGPRRLGDPARLTASADRWSTISGWKPEYNIDDMITHAWRWYTR